MSKPIKFRPIPESHGRGECALDIYPPGTFINNKHFDVVVGGGGYGDRKTLAAAKKYLYESALAYCDRQIATAKGEIEHYERQRAILVKNGLVRKP